MKIVKTAREKIEHKEKTEKKGEEDNEGVEI